MKSTTSEKRPGIQISEISINPEIKIALRSRVTTDHVGSAHETRKAKGNKSK